MTSPRGLLALLACCVALVLQSAVLSHLAWQGVTANLVLLVVVGAGLVQGSQFAMTLGFVAGLLLDLAPPADHVAGRWALALLVAGWVAGRARRDDLPSYGAGATTSEREHRGPTLGAALATVAACSLLASSVFALTGLLLGDLDSGVGDVLPVVLVGVVLDVAVAAVVVPLALRLVRRRTPGRVTV